MKNTIITLITIILLAVSSVAFARECPLCDAAFQGNLSEIERLLDNGANVNDANKNGWTALMRAALGHQIEVTKVLLEHGANVNYDENEVGFTALIIAAYEGYSEVVKVLLDNGANVNHGNEDGSTALIQAAANGHSKVAKVLLEHGANINYKGVGGFTALIAATYE